MTGLSRLLQLTIVLLFSGLALLTVGEWARHRGRARLDLAIALGSLSCVATMGLLVQLAGWRSVIAEDVSVVLFLCSGLAFLRFRHALIALPPATLVLAAAANGIVGIVAVAARLPETGEAGLSTFQTTAVIMVIVTWMVCTGEPILTFWRMASRVPPVQRARLRSLALGYSGIMVILVVALLLGTAAQTAPFRVASQLVAVAMLPFLYASVAPPAALRRHWRHGEEAALRAATVDLVQFARDAQTVARRSLPWAIRLVGAESGFIAGADGRVIETQGLTEQSVAAIVARAGEPRAYSIVSGLGGRRRDTAIVVPVPSRLGRAFLGTVSGAFTPIFGTDEVECLVQYCDALAATFDRVEFTSMVRMLQEIATAANDTVSVGEAAGKVLASVCAFTRWRLGHAIFPSPPEDREGPAVHAWHPRQHEADAEFRAATEHGAAGPGTILSEVLGEGRGRIVPRLAAVAGFPLPAEAAGAGLKAAVWIPVQANQEVVGALEFYSDREGGPDPSVMQALDSAGAALGRVYERSRAMAAAEKASAAKSEYLSRMGHELRTPLTVIIGYADMLALRRDGADQRQIDAILNASKHLLSLINDVLDLSRIDWGPETLNIQPTSMNGVIDRCLGLVAPIGALSNVRIETAIDPAVPPVLADPTRLVQAIVNLASNAIKYGTSGGRIVLSVQPAGGFVRVAVTDFGPGIPEDKAALLFVPFERIGAEHTTITGTGLGLALVKRLAEGMGGRAGLESAVGRGSTFWVEVPVATTGGPGW